MCAGELEGKEDGEVEEYVTEEEDRKLIAARKWGGNF